MNNHQYLVEVRLEEMPARYVRSVAEQFQTRVADFLAEQRLPYDTIQAFATPRRFAVLVSGLADKQADTVETAKGPAEAIARDADGNWSKAAQGFARGKGVSVDDIYFKDIKGKSYAHVDIEKKGKPATECLTSIGSVIEAMRFPSAMTWSTHRHFRYLRPLHGIVSLFDKEVVPLRVLDIEAGRETMGHRFLSEGPVTLAFAGDYVETLREHYVLVDQDERKQAIERQIKQIETEHHLHVIPDDELLEEITQIVEWPTALLGNFADKYLALPHPVLITSMRENQRYFAVEDEQGELAPHFVAVRNGDKTNLDGIQAGNERVLVARLEDAAFFIEEDEHQTVDGFAEQLSEMTFHREIGSLRGKMQTTTALAHALYGQWETTDFFAGELYDEFTAQIERTGAIYKFDLVTSVVDEFPKLQGVIGAYYANEAGEDAAVATAIQEHYLPLSAGGAEPETTLGTLFAIADRLDTLIHFFKIGKIPSGSNDPYALRRAMIGIVAMITHHQLPLRWDTTLPTWLTEIYHLDKDAVKTVTDQLLQFMDDRLQNTLEGTVRPDISQAARAATVKDIVSIEQSAEALETLASDTATFKEQAEAWQRTLNLAVKADQTLVERWRIREGALETASERALYDATMALEADTTAEQRVEQLVALAPLITDFFTENLVMADDETVRNNRLVLLQKLAAFILSVADVRLITEKVAD